MSLLQSIITETESSFVLDPTVELRPSMVTRAQNDAEAIALYRRLQCGNSIQTALGFDSALMKLLWWMSHTGQLRLRDLKIEDCEQFQDWLRNPDEASIGPRTNRTLPNNFINPKWRPLQGPLKGSSITSCIRRMSSLYGFLKELQYLDANPFGALNTRMGEIKSANEKPLKIETIALIHRYILSPDYPHSARTRAADRWLLMLLFHTGHRVTAASQASFTHLESEDGTRVLKLLVKGKKEHSIPFPDALMDELSRYRAAFRLATPPRPGEPSALYLGSRAGFTKNSNSRNDPTQGLDSSSLRRHIYRIRDEAADWIVEQQLMSESDTQIKRLRSATPHTFRHSAITDLVNQQESSIHDAQDLAGHSSYTTTESYRATDYSRAQSALETHIRRLSGLSRLESDVETGFSLRSNPDARTLEIIVPEHLLGCLQATASGEYDSDELLRVIRKLVRG